MNFHHVIKQFEDRESEVCQCWKDETIALDYLTGLPEGGFMAVALL